MLWSLLSLLCNGSLPQVHEETVLIVISLGGDTDIVAGVSAGIVNGFDAISDNSIEMVQNKVLVDYILS